MRLQLAFLWFCVAVFVCVPARADERVGLRTDVYTDQWLVVISPSSNVSADATDELTFEGGVAVDVLSGATQVFTTDAVTAATSFEETRREAHLTASYAIFPTWSVDAGYAASIEPDHDAHSGTVSTSVELLDRMSTLSTAYTFVHEHVGRVDDPGYGQRAFSHFGDASWTQIFTRGTVATLLLSGHYSGCANRLGCHANPYRSVALLDPADDVLTLVPERHPNQRVRGAAAVRLAQHLAKTFALHAGYRFYADTWRITGHTADLALAKGFWAERLVTRLEGRFVWQDTAAFFRDNYRADPMAIGIPEHRSGDRELARTVNGMVAARAEVSAPPVGPVTLRFRARIARLWYRYLNFTELPRRDAWLVGGGLSAEF